MGFAVAIIVQRDGDFGLGDGAVFDCGDGIALIAEVQAIADLNFGKGEGEGGRLDDGFAASHVISRVER